MHEKYSDIYNHYYNNNGATTSDFNGPGENIIWESSGNKNLNWPNLDAPIIFIFGLPNLVPAISCITYTILSDMTWHIDYLQIYVNPYRRKNEL